jgi:hypothetical protein
VPVGARQYANRGGPALRLSAQRRGAHPYDPFSMRAIPAYTGLVAIVALMLVPAARGATCQAPPGRSAIVEYCETVPGAKKAPASHPTVPPATRRALTQAGPAGVQVLALTRKHARRHQHRAAAAPPSAVSGVGSAIGGVDSAGSLLLWVLLGVALALASAAAWMYRRRRRST